MFSLVPVSQAESPGWTFAFLVTLLAAVNGVIIPPNLTTTDHQHKFREKVVQKHTVRSILTMASDGRLFRTAINK